MTALWIQKLVESKTLNQEIYVLLCLISILCLIGILSMNCQNQCLIAIVMTHQEEKLQPIKYQQTAPGRYIDQSQLLSAINGPRQPFIKDNFRFCDG